MITRRRLLRLAGALAVLALGIFAASRMHIAAALSQIAHARPLFVVTAAVLNFPLILVQALRWRLLLKRTGPLSRRRLFRYLLASHMLNSWLPARAGDLLRIYLPSTRDGLPTITVASTLLLERLFDALGLLCIAAPLFFVPSVPPTVRVGLLALLELALLGLATVSWLAKKKHREGPLADFRRAALSLRNFKSVAKVASFSLLYWSLELLLVTVSLASMDVVRGLEAAALVLVAVNLGSLVQLTPGNFVTFEAAVVGALAVCGVRGPAVVAAAVVYHMVQVLPVTVAGLEGLRLVGAARSGEREQPASQGPASPTLPPAKR